KEPYSPEEITPSRVGAAGTRSARTERTPHSERSRAESPSAVSADAEKADELASLHVGAALDNLLKMEGLK
ncbi:MAG: hypothetical protein IKI51_04705, partial [Clostridia bacterium]|nr:hypothetical protein [Clostridia bacterium]